VEGQLHYLLGQRLGCDPLQECGALASKLLQEVVADTKKQKILGESSIS